MDEHGPALPTRLRRPAINTRGEVGRLPPPSLDPLTRAALDCAPFGMIVLDNDTQVRLITRQAAQFLGLLPGIHNGSRTLMQMAGQSHAIDLPALRILGTLLHDPGGDREPGREALLALPGPGGGMVARLTLHRAEAQGWLVTLDEPRPAETATAFLLQQDAADPVTGLANKRHFLRTLRDRLETSDGRMVAVLRLSLHLPAQTADPDHVLLRTAARRLQFCIRGNDLAARFIGTEFAVMFTQLSHRAVLRQLSDRLSEAIARPFMIEGKSVELRGHIGLAGTPEDGTTAEELLANAEIALSAARTGRAGAWQAFEAHLDDVASQRRHLVKGLRRALVEQEFILHYQPQLEVLTGRVRVLEALIRWQSPDRGMVPPNDFIPIAEATGQIKDIGNWVVAQACRDAAGWPEDIAVAVNASPLQIEDPGFADAVGQALQRAGLPAHRLEIEITENLLLQPNDSVNTTLTRLRDMGVNLVMDDFGTGYASLSQLARFRFNKIKIDRSLVSAADTVAEHSAIVRAIAALGVSLCVPTTAEGVETMSQLDRIAQDGCTLVQGYYFSRPVPADAVPALLEKLGAASQFQAA
jgi:diguanylate cyclase (GGDEF)-like protein